VIPAGAVERVYWKVENLARQLAEDVKFQAGDDPGHLLPGEFVDVENVLGGPLWRRLLVPALDSGFQLAEPRRVELSLVEDVDHDHHH